MFIRKATRKYKDRSYTNYLLVESVHTPKGPRQKVLCSLGDLSPRPAKAWLQLAHKVEDALVGQARLSESADAEVAQIVRQVRQRQARGTPARRVQSVSADDDLLSVHADRVRIERPRAGGPVHVGYEFWKRLGLSEILRAVGFSPRAAQLTCAMTLNRLVHPASEHAMPAWIRATALEDILGVDFESLADDALYRNLDRLHPQRAVIEAALGERERSLFNLAPTVFFYDLTSTYFEGQALANPKAKRGYSRDKRPDCKQVVVGLVIGREGFPIAHEIFAGNVQDRQTLAHMLDLLAQRVGLAPGTTVVVDRGLAYAENLAEIKARKLHYVIAARQPERDAWLDDFEEAEGFEEVLLRTDREDLRGPEAWLLYMTLTRAESAFRSMKSPLAERPIFHHLEHRVETHIFLCLLAYHLLVAIETTLLGQGLHTSWATVRETLATHQVVTIVLPTDRHGILQIRKGSHPEPQHLELYRLFSIPAEMMKPRKTWTPSSEGHAQ